MILVYSGKSAPSAKKIEAQGFAHIIARRQNLGDINWGRATAQTILNPDITNSTNKRVMRELFAEHGVPMPKLQTHPIWDFKPNGELLTPLVGRPDKHMKGRGYWLCNSIKDVQRALRGTRRKAAATHFMEFVESDHEYRVHVFKGKSIRISEKKFTGENFHDYTTIKPTGDIKQVRKAAKQAVMALGLDFGAVDILADSDDKAYVLECNASPGLGGTMPEVYARTFKRWYEEEHGD